MTEQPDADPASKPEHRTASVGPAVWLILLGLVVALMYGIFMVRQALPPEAPPSPLGTGGAEPSPGETNPLDDLKAATGPESLLRPVGGETFKGLPAALPGYPGLQTWKADRQRYKPGADGKAWVVEQGVWAVKDADLNTVATFYQTAAEKSGLKVFRSTDREGIFDRVFVAEGRDLLIRTKRSGGQVLLIMRYRYTM